MKLLFLDCDSTLSAIEGIDELAALRGPEVEAEVAALTNAAMNGEVPIGDIFARRLDLIRPTAADCREVARLYIEQVAPGAAEALRDACADGWTPVIISGGFVEPIRPFAAFLGIAEVHAVPLLFDADGRYLGFDQAAPTARNGGKPELIRQISATRQPTRTAMVGDGISDLETLPVVDLFIGFGGFTPRPAVQQQAPAFITHFRDLPPLLHQLA